MHMEDTVEGLRFAVEHRKELPQVATLLIGELDTRSYDELQRVNSRQRPGKEWQTYRMPNPLAKLGCWLQSLLPGTDPFRKP